jgi:hypothetical protein
MSRPIMEEKDKRIVQVNIRLTKSEYDKVLLFSQASCLSAANWIRKKIFTGKFPDVKLSPIDTSVYQELHKIGVNLNQAVHKINAGQMPADFGGLLLQLLAKKIEIIKLLTDDSRPGKR